MGIRRVVLLGAVAGVAGRLRAIWPVHAHLAAGPDGGRR